MKTTLTILFLFCAAAAFGQVGSICAQSQPIQIADHPLHAEYHDMGVEHPLVGGVAGGVTYAQGERPLWEFGSVSTPVPLGDVARAFRKERLAARKAERTLDKQGS